MRFTRSSHLTTVVDTRISNIQNERIMKSQVILDYNEGRQGNDLLDQLSGYQHTIHVSDGL